MKGIPSTAWPTINQLAAIGSVAATWSWLDLSLEGILAKLVHSDEMLAQALTEDLSPDNRLKALRRLTRTWEQVHPDLTDAHKAQFDEVREIVKWVAANKARRNEIVHWLWLRRDDARLFGWKHRVTPAIPSEARASKLADYESFLEFSREIGSMADRAAETERALSDLPPWPKPTALPGTPLSPAVGSLLSPYRRRG
ncbi:hypothetical protein OMW55_00610 [Sphingomonas sp. BN140010]|uniref:Uncharacterized protein n=1 Tax=Sphingomonas arvum TaxID=2992113 RepID=A0ABT3JB75_9SPHN|nr:hypothetical protein [Sphingomonas sp. BN140010]MCW3796312.1 hypothetical protein [Sphingomonas sp. BN140010]